MVAGRGLQPGHPRIALYTASDFQLLAGVDADRRVIGGHRLYGKARVSRKITNLNICLLLLYMLLV